MKRITAERTVPTQGGGEIAVEFRDLDTALLSREQRWLVAALLGLMNGHEQLRQMSDSDRRTFKALVSMVADFGEPDANGNYVRLTPLPRVGEKRASDV